MTEIQERSTNGHSWRECGARSGLGSSIRVLPSKPRLLASKWVASSEGQQSFAFDFLLLHQGVAAAELSTEELSSGADSAVEESLPFEE